MGIGGGGNIDDLNGNRNDSTKSGFIGGGIVWARQAAVRYAASPLRRACRTGAAWKKGVKEAFRHSFY
jgi:gluconate 2-dehydrogenase alpha chain